MAKKVEIIPPVKQAGHQNGNSTIALKRVAADARVSSNSDEQENSFDNQVAKWTKAIQENPNYQLAGVYTDEGISGTSIKHREGFQKMIEDAKAGKIDKILCKSISRFSRNTVDTLKTIRELKEIGVEVYFDNEHLSTLDPKNEFIFTVLGSMAQEESRHISENVTWTFQSKMKAGIPFVNTTRFLGYDKNEDKTELIINEEQAKTVRYIFNLYDAGEGCNKICQKLHNEGYKNLFGTTKWHASTITEILKNEKYVGDLLLQKTYTADFLSHKRKKNNGERQKYSVKDAHQAIISREQWDRVQKKLADNSAHMRGKNLNSAKYANKYPLSGMLICSKCGGTYKRRLWNSKHTTARKFIFQCNHYSTIDPNGQPCRSKAISESLAEQACCDIINKLYFSKSKVFVKVSNVIKLTLSAEKMEAQKKKIDETKLDLSQRMDELAKQRLSTDSIDTKKVIDNQWDDLRKQFEQLDLKLKTIEEREISSLNTKERMEKMLKMLSKQKLTPEMLTKDILETFFYRIIVSNPNELTFVINATHSMDFKAFIDKRNDIIALKAIYESEITGLDPVKKATLKFKVVAI